MSTTETAIDDQPTPAADERPDVVVVARDVFGWDPLRPGIEQAVAQVLDGTDVLAVMPTGYGKSAVYQLAGAVVPGLTVVVSPLIALQADQVQHLAETAGAKPAALLNSTLTAKQVEAAWAGVDDGSLGYLFLAPEQLANDATVERLAAARVSLLVVDEAHCVSSWGHDFRPDYLRLGEAVERLGRPAILALTATGSRPVRQEILERLGMPDATILTHGFDRPNIHLAVHRYEDEDAKIDAVIEEVAALAKPGLLYVATQKATEVLAARLADLGVHAEPYHGSMAAKRRKALHEAFHAGEVEVVVATSAFGMGIDKADVRFVVHAAIPESLDAYYQELGRAGRDGEPAAATLRYREEDLGLRKFFGTTKPRKKALQRFHAVAGGQEELRAIAEALDVGVRRAATLANLFADAGAATVEGDRVHLVELDGERAVQAALDAAEARQRIDESRLAMMREYAETRGCRRTFVLGYFGDATAGPCGNCDTCDDGSAYRIADAEGEHADEPFPVDATVRHAAWGEGRVMSTEEDRITVFFDSEGYRTLSLQDVADHDLLARTDSPAARG